jgi:hypothetical protein
LERPLSNTDELVIRAAKRALICRLLFAALALLAAYFAVGMSGPEFKDFARINWLAGFIPVETLAKWFVAHYDKVVHGSGAFLLTLTALGGSKLVWLGRLYWLPVLLSFGFIFGFSWLIEFLQHQTGRPFTWADIWAACLGSALAISAVWLVLILVSKMTTRKSPEQA